jgi:uncharacterized repeat protein (TIGR04138 family)
MLGRLDPVGCESMRAGLRVEQTIVTGMAEQPTKTLADVARAVGRYPEEAYQFVREGLNCAVEHVHGPPTPELLKITKYLADHEIDLAELFEQIEEGKADPKLVRAVEAAGGYEKLNRHVSGQELCWSLRDLALERWGLMAQAVLRSWNIRETLDFGKIVFALIEHELMQRQPDDRLEDFDQVYAFSEALSGPFRISGEGAGDGS